MTQEELEKYLLGKQDSFLDFPFGRSTAVYKVRVKSDADTETGNQGKMFAIVPLDKKPIRISLKCDPGLAEFLRDKYESVQPGFHLNKKHWNTILLTGQLDNEQIKDLIDHSYQLVAGS